MTTATASLAQPSMPLAPGCYGAASVFSFDSAVCNKCAQFGPCRDASRKRLEELRSLIDVSDLLARHERSTGRSLSVPKRGPERGLAGVTLESALMTIEPPPRKTKVEVVRFALSDAELRLIGSLPLKAASELRKLLERNQAQMMREKLSAGENPFPLEGKRFLHVACDLLLSGGFTRSQLARAYRERLAWGQSTAAAHVSIVVALLPAIKIAREADGRFVLTPAS